MRLLKYNKTTNSTAHNITGRVWHLCLLVGLIALGACSHTPSAARDEQVRTSMWLANQYISRADYFGAMRLLDAVEPTKRKAHWYGSYALLYAQQGYVAQAQTYYQRALRHDNAAGAIHLNYASLLIEQQKYKPAQIELQRLVHTEHGVVRAFAYFNLGVVGHATSSDTHKTADNFWQAATSCAKCHLPERTRLIRHYLSFAQAHQVPFMTEAAPYALRVACEQDQFAWLLEYNWSNEQSNTRWLHNQMSDEGRDRAAWRSDCARLKSLQL